MDKTDITDREMWNKCTADGQHVLFCTMHTTLQLSIKTGELLREKLDEAEAYIEALEDNMRSITR